MMPWKWVLIICEVECRPNKGRDYGIIFVYVVYNDMMWYVYVK